MRVLQIILLIFSFSLCTEIRYEGPMPPQLDTVSLRKEYKRIQKIINPEYKSDTTPILIRFYTSTDQRTLGIRIPEWGGGGAAGKDLIVIPVDKKYAFHNTDFYRIISHEMVHIALARSYGKLHVPRWFHEGVAMALSGELSFDEHVILSRAVLTGSLLSLDTIEKLNRFDYWKAQLAYCQSHFAVSFLIDMYGIDFIPELLSATEQRRNFERGCLEVFGLSKKEFEDLLQKEIRKRFKYLFLISDYSLFWIGLTILSIVAFAVTIVRNRKKARLMEMQEELEGSETTDEQPAG
jgi:hypothetical protein